MKCTAAFVVLSMVVFMAEPGECFLGMLIHGAIHTVGHLFGGHDKAELQQEQQELQQQQEQLDKRSIDYNPGRPHFH
ncbi:pleurocidin-like peptide WF3 [Dicentrarchus labrax]|uniref:Uncharacterized protein n=1 Tax=Dicentrarchus labrax TaxID=13489 RepID=A0A8C4DTV8_DICLA|nr:pleurocidin-like peptide WF3 [Dicentrarchus labrax]